VRDAVEQYCKWFDYVVHWRGKVTAAVAGLWEAPGVIGHASAIVGPKDMSRGLVRFVEVPGKPTQPFTTRGWAALEIRTRDVDELSKHLEESPFKRIGGPADLKFTAKPHVLRAVQFLGPGEVPLYCTQSLADPNGPYPGGQLGPHNVGALFIIVLACWPYPATRDFYVRTLAMTQGAESPRPLRFANQYLGWPEDRNGILSTARCGSTSLLELDGYPEEISLRPIPKRGLPSGVSICTLSAPDIKSVAEVLTGAAVPFRRLDSRVAEPPYSNGAALVCRGASGEVVEVVEERASLG